MKVKFSDLGLIGYKLAWDYQKELFNSMMQAKINGGFPIGELIFCEHTPVYTLGKSGERSNLLATPEWLRQTGAEVYEIERGGDITFHGPGQLVVYPVFDLEQAGIGLKEYIFRMESCIIQTIKEFDVEGERIEGLTGIWVGKGTAKERKIAAIGVKSSRYITMHGLAMNVNTDLTYFNHIVPCGIPDKAVTSISVENRKINDMEIVKEAMKKQFKAIFELTF